ncbi:hypothetical protein L539_4475 [Bordetella hinzii 5132]|nr:hypothetical protein L539_4475 [Bordetella hinzii 5132]
MKNQGKATVGGGGPRRTPRLAAEFPRRRPGQATLPRARPGAG